MIFYLIIICTRICDFEQGQTCIFEPSLNSNATALENWKVYSASSERLLDHTTHSSDGHFYGLDLSHQATPTSSHTMATFDVLSRSLNGSTFRCLQFSYMLEGVLPSTTLSYDITTSGTGAVDRKKVTWKVAGSTLGLWFTHRLRPPLGVTFTMRMSIEAKRGEKKEVGKVFVDDVKFLTGSCESPNSCDFEVGVSISNIIC